MVVALPTGSVWVVARPSAVGIVPAKVELARTFVWASTVPVPVQVWPRAGGVVPLQV